MPEILRNLVVARFLLRLGIKIWLGGFELNLNDKIYDNNKEQKIGSRKRAFSGAFIFSQTSIFRLKSLLCLQISHLRKSLVHYGQISYNIYIL